MAEKFLANYRLRRVTCNFFESGNICVCVCVYIYIYVCVCVCVCVCVIFPRDIILVSIIGF